MTTKEKLHKFYSEIKSAHKDGMVFHKNRFATLLRRVEMVVDLVNPGENGISDIHYLQAMDLLLITTEEIKDYALVFSTKNETLAKHVVMYGSDEELFIK